MTDLFSIPISESPRLKWIRKHGVVIEHTEHSVGDEDEFGNDLWPVYAGKQKGIFFGADTEDAAIANFAKFHKIKLWNEESL